MRTDGIERVILGSEAGRERLKEISQQVAHHHKTLG
jgi:hypothetical protein